MFIKIILIKKYFCFVKKAKLIKNKRLSFYCLLKTKRSRPFVVQIMSHPAAFDALGASSLSPQPEHLINTKQLLFISQMIAAGGNNNNLAVLFVERESKQLLALQHQRAHNAPHPDFFYSFSLTRTLKSRRSHTPAALLFARGAENSLSLSASSWPSSSSLKPCQHHLPL